MFLFVQSIMKVLFHHSMMLYSASLDPPPQKYQYTINLNFALRELNFPK